ncbi:Serine--tRNA ligase, mitochondrial [Podospora bellae-mahoneyi]|uniref:serine--tRNA ligase n=1 Tax=Podospora bellae-mahoneyi TaxID=2093777 RepID=A0ABR0FA83_9PEZI|nr:Serine--tRNA ligase, mitochondrial [Podospora bellae-mahoneyi]
MKCKPPSSNTAPSDSEEPKTSKEEVVIAPSFNGRSWRYLGRFHDPPQAPSNPFPTTAFRGWISLRKPTSDNLPALPLTTSPTVALMRPSLSGVAASKPFTCLPCLLRTSTRNSFQRPVLTYTERTTPRLSTAQFSHSARQLHAQEAPDQTAAFNTAASLRPTTAPKPLLDIKHIRLNPDLYSQNCIDRNYKSLAEYPHKINALFAEWQAQQKAGRALRERGNILRRRLAGSGGTSRDDPREIIDEFGDMSREEILEEARKVKAGLAGIEETEGKLQAEMERLALAIPNLTSDETPRGTEPEVMSYINNHPEPEPALSDRVWRSHVHVGAELGLLDFAGAASSSGWGWYYLLDEAADLEQALISYALATATRAGWRQVSPPSVVYGHIAAACGFQPRDANGETQIYAIAQSREDAARGKPELVLAGTAEIPLAGMKADTVLDEADLPLKRVAVSRCYRAEAGARGSETKGLYRVHEFTKVEMFSWTLPDQVETEEIFDEMIDLQTEILGGLGLHCRVLEMPTADLGASATRKCDIEAFFPSRRERNDGWGEVTSASICTDYQTRRLATRLKTKEGKLVYPWTVNGTALAVPRVLAAILENGWNESEKSVLIPEVLRPWMDGREKIGPRHRMN